VGPPRDLGNLAWFVLITGTGVGYSVYLAYASGFLQAPAGGLRIWGICGLIVAQALCTRWRARPLAALAAVVALQTFAVILFPGAAGLAAGPAWVFALCNVTFRVRRPRWVIALAIAAAADATSQLAAYARAGVHLTAYVGGDVMIATLTSYAIVAPFGVLAGWYWRRADVVDAYAAALSREQAAVAAASMAAERNRVARELHDVAAHHLYGTLLQIRAAASVLDTKPGLAAELLDTVEREAGLAAESLSGVVSLPQPGTGENADGPALSRLPELVESVRASNPLAELTVSGDLAGLSAAVSLACYRIIQESLSNARRHAPGAGIAVQVQRDADEVTVEVRNTAPPPGREVSVSTHAGFGVIGMRERATTLGGQLDSGPDENGGWVTRATIPAGQRVAAGLR
jgi:signal transduction histidine kinase